MLMNLTVAQQELVVYDLVNLRLRIFKMGMFKVFRIAGTRKTVMNWSHLANERRMERRVERRVSRRAWDTSPVRFAEGSSLGSSIWLSMNSYS